MKKHEKLAGKPLYVHMIKDAIINIEFVMIGRSVYYVYVRYSWGCEMLR